MTQSWEKPVRGLNLYCGADTSPNKTLGGINPSLMVFDSCPITRVSFLSIPSSNLIF